MCLIKLKDISIEFNKYTFTLASASVSAADNVFINFIMDFISFVANRGRRRIPLPFALGKNSLIMTKFNIPFLLLHVGLPPSASVF